MTYAVLNQSEQRFDSFITLNALTTMNGKRDALAIVETSNGPQVKVMTLFDRFIALFRYTKAERETLFDAARVVEAINECIQPNMSKLSQEQNTKVLSNLSLLSKRLQKREINLGDQIENLFFYQNRN